MRKKWLHLMRIAPLALLFAGVASAQTTGTILGVVTDFSTGKPVAGAVVVASSPALQGEQTVVTGADGAYRLPLLPPGEYTLSVQLEGYKPAERSDITLRLDKTIRANLSVVPDAVQIEEQVVRTGAAPVVNVGSAETGAVVSNEFLSTVPVARGYEQIAIVAPTARNDLYGISFAGSQSPENQYIVDGLNTTDPTFGTRAGGVNGPPALRSNFLQEVDIKTGSFGAEYGRATGGILNVVLKSGSNEFHGSVFSNFEPDFLVTPDGRAIGAAGEAIAYRSKPDEGTYELDLGFEVGGPIMKDKLWFYAGVAPILQKTYYERFLRANVLAADAGGACPPGSSPTGIHGAGGQCVNDTSGDYLQNTIPGSQTIHDTNRTTVQWVGKLTYLLDENNSFTLSGWGSPADRTNFQTQFFSGAMYNSPAARVTDITDGMNSVFARYGGKFLDKRLLAEVQAGWYGTYNTEHPRTIGGVDQGITPTIEWLDEFNIRDFEAGSDPNGVCADPTTGLDRCPVFGYATGGAGGLFDWTTNRFAGKASLSYLFEGLGSHNLKGGIDLERVDYSVDRSYAADAYYLFTGGVFSAFRGFGNINATTTGPDGAVGIEVPQFLGDNSLVTRGARGNTSRTNSFAYFLQDSWQFGFLPERLGTFTLNYGLRLETQSMENVSVPDSTGFDINDNWSPRLQGIWDFTGNGRGKLAGSWGRYYYAMPLDMGDRAFGTEISLRYNLSPASCGFDGTNPGAFNNQNLALPFQNSGTSCTLLQRGGDFNDIRLTGGLTPADPELEGAFIDQFGGQLEYELISDLSFGLEYTGKRQGNIIEDMSSNDGGSYFIGNPGKNRNIPDPNSATGFSNSKFVETLDPQTGRTLNVEFPKPERSYDAFTVKATKLFSQNWLAQASYTYATLRGNYPGPFRPESGQLDPGITSEYDLASLTANRTGFLPGDQRHQVKVYGAYVWNFGPRFNVTASGAYSGFSGIPVNALGAHPDYGPSEAFILPRGQAGRTPFVHNVDLGGALQYTVRAPYAVKFGVEVFNVFNTQEILEYDEDYTFDSIAPIGGLNCETEAAGKANPQVALRDACPELAFLKTVDGNPVTVNPNWGKQGRSATTSVQAPLSLRFSLALTF